ncbi:hypothetical protein K0I73_00200 [Shewanella mesophila]|uniref:hypothetical protein n=1 Tax=Shewanella mesophila TaxID=2864208 RepID=UPI001C65B273|nr:hypothetical protein [Shewanella mesophila]QYJ86244.1 hypothetical protein K0I73_00200 [Shewanella mesophila]
MDRLSWASVTLDINSNKNDSHYAMLISEDYDLNTNFSSRLLINTNQYKTEIYSAYFLATNSRRMDNGMVDPL